MSLHLCMVSPYIYPSLVPGSGVQHAGGAEIQQAMIARLLVRDGYRVSVLTKDFGQTDHVRADGDEGDGAEVALLEAPIFRGRHIGRESRRRRSARGRRRVAGHPRRASKPIARARWCNNRPWTRTRQVGGRHR